MLPYLRYAAERQVFLDKMRYRGAVILRPSA